MKEGEETCQCSVVVCGYRGMQSYATSVVGQGLVMVTCTVSLGGEVEWQSHTDHIHYITIRTSHDVVRMTTYLIPLLLFIHRQLFFIR